MIRWPQMNTNMPKVIIPRAEHSISRSLLSPSSLKVLYKLKEQGFLGYLVGGGVRDLLLGRDNFSMKFIKYFRSTEVLRAQETQSAG